MTWPCANHPGGPWPYQPSTVLGKKMSILALPAQSCLREIIIQLSNKLASLKATLIQNYNQPTDQPSD